MNPNATPFQPAARPDRIIVVPPPPTSIRRLALLAPLAPIEMLSGAEKQSMQFLPHNFKDSQIVLADLQAASVAISVTEFVLE
jgi:hypothetical protein